MQSCRSGVRVRPRERPRKARAPNSQTPTTDGANKPQPKAKTDIQQLSATVNNVSKEVKELGLQNAMLEERLGILDAFAAVQTWQIKLAAAEGPIDYRIFSHPKANLSWLTSSFSK